MKAAPVSTRNCCLLSSSCKKITPPRELSVPGGLAISRLQPTRFAFLGVVAVCGVVVTDLTVLLVRPRGILAAVPLAARGTAFSPLVTGQELPATVPGNGAVGSLVLRVDGSDSTAGSAAVQQVGIFRHQRGVFETFGDQVVSHF